MKKKIRNKEISRKEALSKMKIFGKYAAFTAIGTYIILNPKQAHARSPESPGDGF